MPRTVVYELAGRRILVIDPLRDRDGNPLLPTDTPSAATDISDTEAAKFAQASGGFQLDQDGQTVIVLPEPPPNPVQVELAASRSDLQTQYDAAMTRLAQIVSQMGVIAGYQNPTNAQVVTAVQTEATAIGDLATDLQRVARLVKNVLT